MQWLTENIDHIYKTFCIWPIMGELGGVYHKYFGENLTYYNGTTLHAVFPHISWPDV